MSKISKIAYDIVIQLYKKNAQKRILLCLGKKDSKMSILSKDKIKKNILPYLSFGKTGVSLSEEKRIGIVSVIFYRLKTGCQWRELPLKQYIEGSYTYQSVHYHFSRWVKDGSWKKLWIALLEKYKNTLDMSCVQLDGTQTRVRQGGEAVGFQARRADDCTNFFMFIR